MRIYTRLKHEKPITQTSVHATSTPIRRLWSRKSLIVFCCIAVSVAFSLFLYKRYMPTKLQDKAEYLDILRESNKDDSSKAKLVDTYSGQFDDNWIKVNNSNMDRWDADMLDNAYSALLYADSVEAYNQVNTLLASIDRQANLGLDIDNNSYKIGNSEREEFKRRAREDAQKRVDSAQIQEIPN